MASGSDVSETVFHFLPIKKVMLIKNENGREQFIYLKEITLKLTRLLEFLQLAFVALVDPSCYFSHLPIAWSLVLKGLWEKKEQSHALVVYRLYFQLGSIQGQMQSKGGYQGISVPVTCTPVGIPVGGGN